LTMSATLTHLVKYRKTGEMLLSDKRISLGLEVMKIFIHCKL